MDLLIKRKNIIQTKNTSYDPETGISKAWIATGLGDFFGEAKLSPEDKDIESNFAGCQYAEMRAILKYFNYKIKLIKVQLESLQRVEKDIARCKESQLHPDNKPLRIIRKEIKRLKDILIYDTINRDNIQKKLDNDIKTRKETVDYILKKIKNKQGKE